MYSHKIITGNAWGNFSKVESTLHIASFSSVNAVPPKWKDVFKDENNCKIHCVSLNAGWSNNNHQSFYEGMLK
jgi:hypothetical protein